MIYKINSLILLMLFNNMQSQVKLSIQLTNDKAKNLSLTLKNFSKKNIVFPLDQNGLVPELIEWVKSDDTYENYNPFLPIISLRENGILLEAIRRNYEIDINAKIKNKKSDDNILILLKPGEEYSYKIHFNTKEFYDTLDHVFYWTYITEKKYYDLTIKFSISKESYIKKNKLIKKLPSDYDLFIGTIKSNSIKYLAD